MTTEDNKALVRAFNATFDRRDLDACMKLIDENLVSTATGAPGPMNAEAFRGVGEAFLAAFSNARHVFSTQIAEGDWVASRGMWTAAHTGSFNGIPATGATVTFSIFSFDRIKDGKLVEHHASFDIPSLMMQIGAVPAAA
jgi:predicted ester cyclase